MVVSAAHIAVIQTFAPDGADVAPGNQGPLRSGNAFAPGQGDAAVLVVGTGGIFTEGQAVQIHRNGAVVRFGGGQGEGFQTATRTPSRR